MGETTATKSAGQRAYEAYFTARDGGPGFWDGHWDELTDEQRACWEAAGDAAARDMDVPEPLGMLAPDAVATYAAMLKAVGKPCPNDPPCEHAESDHDPAAGSPGEPPWCLDCDCGDASAETCESGCGCRYGTDDPDRKACACKGPCTMLDDDWYSSKRLPDPDTGLLSKRQTEET